MRPRGRYKDAVVARDQDGQPHDGARARKEPLTRCEAPGCGTWNWVDYEGWCVGQDDETYESYSEWCCGECGAENLSAQPYPWGFSEHVRFKGMA
jgi:hypothetical protein